MSRIPEEELDAIERIWRIDDPALETNVERGEAILMNKLVSAYRELVEENERYKKALEEIEQLEGRVHFVACEAWRIAQQALKGGASE